MGKVSVSRLRSLVSDARRRGRPETASALDELLAARARLRAADELAMVLSHRLDGLADMAPHSAASIRAALDAYRNSGGEG